MKPFTNNNFIREILAIFYYVVVCVYSWLLLIFSWDIPSFLLKFTAIDIIGFLSYQLAYALFESVVTTLLVTSLVFLIPIKQVRSRIAAAGALFTLSFAISAIVFKQIVPIIIWLISAFSIGVSAASQAAFALWLFTILGLPIVSVFVVKNKKISTMVASFSENLSVLAGLYVILSIAGIFIVIYRNLL